MKLFGYVLVGLSATGATSTSTDDSAKAAFLNGLPQIIGFQIANQSLVDHHTDHFEIDGGFAVRRGQAFDIIVQTNRKLDLGAVTISFENDDVAEYNNPTFSTSVLKTLSDTSYLVRVDVPVNSAVGKYEDITLSVDPLSELSKTASNASEVFVFEYPFPLYLLFNPWVKEDHVVYIPDEKMRDEHVLNTYGDVFCGSTNSYDTTKWYYGQADQITLDAVFHLLKKVNRTLAADPIHVVQTMAQNQGMMRKHDGSVMVGTEESLLEGNWGDFPFDDTNSPELWTSTTDILNRWKETGKPTKYGQCWVFGALQNALMRAVGVGSRQLTAFGSWMDFSNRRDKHHKLHHVADEYYDINGTAVYMESQAWNYHSWNDIWLQRENETYSGWQSLDGTPPGRIGPAPLKSIRNIDETYLFNVSDVISTVHSTERTFLVKCNKDHKRGDKLKGCQVEKLLKYDHSGLKLILSSQTLENGEITEKNITGEFIDPAKDAFIPFDNEKPTSGRRLRAEEPLSALTLGDAAEDAVSISPDSYGVIVGSPITGFVSLLTAPFVQGEYLQLNLMFTLETRTGKQIKTLMSTSSRVLVKGSKVEVPFFVDSSAYLQKDLGDMFVKIIATGMSDSGKHFFAKDVLDIDSPPVLMKAPEKIQTTEVPEKHAFEVSARFRNPLTFALSNVCLTVHSHQLNFKGLAENATSVQLCEDLKAGATIKIKTELLAPKKAGPYYVLASLSGEYLPFSQSHSLILAEDAVKPSGKAFEEIMLNTENIEALA